MEICNWWSWGGGGHLQDATETWGKNQWGWPYLWLTTWAYVWVCILPCCWVVGHAWVGGMQKC
jgi:hypothetical protein